MKTLSAALLLSLSEQKVTEEGIRTILKSVGAKEDNNEIKKIVESLKDLNPQDIINGKLNQIILQKTTPKYEKVKSYVLVEVNTEVNEIYTKTKIIQKLRNNDSQPLELMIYLLKENEILFSSFEAKIDDSILVKSKVIKREKAEVKYTDSISSGNAAIFVSEDPLNENRIIINMGNIPSKSEITLISEYLRFTKFLTSYEIELSRNIPKFSEKNGDDIEKSLISGNVNIHFKNEIINIKKEITNDSLKIQEEKYINNEKNKYSISYQLSNLYLDYIPSSKIYFDINNNKEDNLLLYAQESSLCENEINYILHWKNNVKFNVEDEFSSYPALFIFLVDQSGSMEGEPMKLASNALKLFIQSLPVGSFYQIIGFGSYYKKYDKIPKEYTKDNIKESLMIIDGLRANLYGTNMYDPLKDIYNSFEYDEIKISKNIILLTDGDINDMEETLQLIENNNSNFSIYSIGIGQYFNQNLIKNLGIIGKGNYNFCPDINELNKIITTEISKITAQPYISEINIISSLDKDTIMKINNQNILKEKEILKVNYICHKNEIIKDKINVEINYNIKDQNYTKSYELIPYTFQKGEELSKLIMYENIIKKDQNKIESLDKALKYQIFYKETSLYAELELSDKIQEEMKLKLIGDKENNCIKYVKKEKEKSYGRKCEYAKYDDYEEDDEDLALGAIFGGGNSRHSNYDEEDDDIGFGAIFDGGGSGYSSNTKEKKKNEIKEKEKNIKFDLKNKDEIMLIIYSQDFIEGYWEINDKTINIKNKYDKEFNKLKNKNYNDNVIITILVIYFINNEYPELLCELMMIIKKAKEFIKKSINIKYEDAINIIN